MIATAASTPKVLKIVVKKTAHCKLDQSGPKRSQPTCTPGEAPSNTSGTDVRPVNNEDSADVRKAGMIKTRSSFHTIASGSRSLRVTKKLQSDVNRTVSLVSLVNPNRIGDSHKDRIKGVDTDAENQIMSSGAACTEPIPETNRAEHPNTGPEKVKSENKRSWGSKIRASASFFHHDRSHHGRTELPTPEDSLWVEDGQVEDDPIEHKKDNRALRRWWRSCRTRGINTLAHSSPSDKPKATTDSVKVDNFRKTNGMCNSAYQPQVGRLHTTKNGSSPTASPVVSPRTKLAMADLRSARTEHRHSLQSKQQQYLALINMYDSGEFRNLLSLSPVAEKKPDCARRRKLQQLAEQQLIKQCAAQQRLIDSRPVSKVSATTTRDTADDEKKPSLLTSVLDALSNEDMAGLLGLNLSDLSTLNLSVDNSVRRGSACSAAADANGESSISTYPKSAPNNASKAHSSTSATLLSDEPTAWQWQGGPFVQTVGRRRSEMGSFSMANIQNGVVPRKRRGGQRRSMLENVRVDLGDNFVPCDGLEQFLMDTDPDKTLDDEKAQRRIRMPSIYGNNRSTASIGSVIDRYSLSTLSLVSNEYSLPPAPRPTYVQDLCVAMDQLQALMRCVE
ncbi:hypothetical protein SARC_10068 [Sphaeroforma arctica JP610]|uniref:Uncharacterized protein n=1 Tax=Sphaeroforma arctica JP610 TaxID=667725 RepID=A0A0L0FL25_9EUKA|nr:hypothetical protein SARC_10068 [Sphaeroforma arctica JP610]KNC77470.1 hypothetical protein SARC_10068 [Sphaeroforma arctica JP610]|eukprot:XP_014151372.1 hypothetical protein SARC_10068 [Sphaeroforma arctica JP610]